MKSGSSSRIVKNTAILYVRMFLTMAVSLYTVRVVLRVLTEVDYGIFSAVGGILAAFAVVTKTLTNASQRFFSYGIGKGESEDSTSSLFSTIFYIYAILAIFVVVLTETVGVWFLQNKMTIPVGRESAAMWVLQFALLSFIISLLSNPFQAMIIAKERMDIYAFVSISNAVFNLLIVYFLTVVDFDQLKLYAVLVTVVHICINIAYVVICRKIAASETKLVMSVNFDRLKSVFSYSLWSFFGALAGICNSQGINIVLNLFFGPIANAAYSISRQVSNAVISFAGNFTMAIRPPMIKNYASKDYDGVTKLFNIETKVTFLLMYMLILPIFINAPEILGIWLGQVGDYMVDFVRLTLVYSLIVTMSNPITDIAQAAARVKIYHGVVDGFTLLSLPITIVLYKLGQPINCCYLVIIATFSIAHVIRLFILKRIFPPFSIRDYVKKIISPILLTTFSSAAIMVCVRGALGDSFFDTMICCASALSIVILFCLFFLFGKSERQYIYGVIRTKFSRNE